MTWTSASLLIVSAAAAALAQSSARQCAATPIAARPDPGRTQSGPAEILNFAISTQ